MERRPGKKVTVYAEGTKADARPANLTAEEERVVRMVHGVRVAPTAPLARVADGSSELADELLMIEMALFRAERNRGAANARGRPSPSADERAKSKIIRALRRKR